MKLLIVEDNHQMRQMMRSFLSDLAQEIYECSDGAEAMDAYAAHQPDWVLMDIEMEVVDGITATRQLKARWPESKVVIVTIHDDARLRAAARQAGACAYLTKDDLFSVRELLTSSVADCQRESH